MALLRPRPGRLPHRDHRNVLATPAGRQEGGYSNPTPGECPERGAVMALVPICPVCGDASGIPTCGSCGAELGSPIASLPARGDDRSASERDQTASDQDQTWSDQDQTASERDQRTSDEDQHAADSDFAAGGDALSYHRSARAREHSSRDRAVLSTLRDEVAGLRMQTAEDRDRAATLRDRGGDGRDHLAQLHDLKNDQGASREDTLSVPSETAHAQRLIVRKRPTIARGRRRIANAQPRSAVRHSGATAKPPTC